MKKLMKGLLFLLATIAFIGTANAQDINTETSYTQYTGYKQLGSKHTGKLYFSSGNLAIADGNLVGGSFTIDINSLTNEDLEGKAKNNFVNHMKSGDFLEAEKYPTAMFEITNATAGSDVEGANYTLEGNLTIKDVTKAITIPANFNGVSLTADIEINRTEYNMKWGSKNFVKNLAANKTVKDKFKLAVSIEIN